MKFTYSIEIPCFTIDVAGETDTWEEAVQAAKNVDVQKYVKVMNGATWLDSDKAKITAILLQD